MMILLSVALQLNPKHKQMKRGALVAAICMGAATGTSAHATVGGPHDPCAGTGPWGGVVGSLVCLPNPGIFIDPLGLGSPMPDDYTGGGRSAPAHPCEDELNEMQQAESLWGIIWAAAKGFACEYERVRPWER